MDVYKGRITLFPTLREFFLYISFFPKIIAGPIERFNGFGGNISNIVFNYDNAVDGLRRILIGYFKKIVIADSLAVYVNLVYDDIHHYEGLILLVISFFYTIQIYCDFSGYSDIAIGVGKLFGINLTENFKFPYAAKSLKEFWSKWHISFSTWLRDYIYIPLGGGKKGKIRKIVNLLLTFLISGIWHGNSITFLVWGGLHGIARSIEEILGERKNAIIGWGMTFLFCSFAWIVFRIDNLSDCLYFFKNMLGGFTELKQYLNELMIGKKTLIYYGCVCTLLILYELKIHKMFNRLNIVCRWCVYYSIIGFIVYTKLNSVVDTPFVYFQF